MIYRLYLSVHSARCIEMCSPFVNMMYIAPLVGVAMAPPPKPVLSVAPITSLRALHTTSDHGEPWPCDVPPTGYDLKTLLKNGSQNIGHQGMALKVDYRDILNQQTPTKWQPPVGYVPQSKKLSRSLSRWEPPSGYDPKDRPGTDPLAP